MFVTRTKKKKEKKPPHKVTFSGAAGLILVEPGVLYSDR